MSTRDELTEVVEQSKVSQTDQHLFLLERDREHFDRIIEFGIDIFDGFDEIPEVLRSFEQSIRMEASSGRGQFLSMFQRFRTWSDGKYRAEETGINTTEGQELVRKLMYSINNTSSLWTWNKFNEVVGCRNLLERRQFEASYRNIAATRPEGYAIIINLFKERFSLP